MKNVNDFLKLAERHAQASTNAIPQNQGVFVAQQEASLSQAYATMALAAATRDNA